MDSLRRRTQKMTKAERYEIRMNKAEVKYGKLKYRLVEKNGLLSWKKLQNKETFIYNNFPMEFIQRRSALYFKHYIEKHEGIDLEIVTI